MVQPIGHDRSSPKKEAVLPVSARTALAVIILAVLIILPAGAANTTATATQTASAVVPDASFSANESSGAAPFTVQFTDQSSGDLSSWAWSFGDGQSATTQNPTHTYTDPGSYSVTLTVTSRAGLTDTTFESEYISVEDADAATTTTATTTVTTTVTTASTINASFTASPVTGGSPLNVTFTDTSTGDIDSWEWDFGDGQQSTARNPSHVYTVPNKYSIYLTVKGDAGTDVEKRQDYITVTDVTATVTTTATTGSTDMVLYIDTPGATRTTTTATRTPTSRPSTVTSHSTTTAAPPATQPPSGGSGLLFPIAIVVIIGAIIGAGFFLYRRRYEDELA